MNGTNDYRSTMQQAAAAYLQANANQYLSSGSDRLFDACVNHLAKGLEVPQFMAEQLAQRAWDEVFPGPAPIWLGIDWGQGDDEVVYLIDTRSHCRFPIPARYLPAHLLKQRPQHTQ
ncbi:TPA: hypothetical protein SL821_003551 [Pseudomonas aeruginosa]|nr:hypothetical protein [Pseudomonas aeruginosa]HEK1487124.1 hypothetical protein [Pseudomonas aeruginosa]